MTDPDRQIWDGMLSHLRTHHMALCRQWFAELEPVGVAGGQYQLRAQSTVHRDYLRRQCTQPFNDAAVTVSGRLLSVRFLGPEDQALPAQKNGHLGAHNGKRPVPTVPPPVAIGPPPAPAGAAGKSEGVSGSALRSQSLVRRDDSLGIDPDYSFENFVVGPGNRLAHAAAVAVGNDPGKAYNPLFIHGGVGLGKTHLLQAACLRIRETNPGAVMYYISCESFVTQFIEAVQANEMADFRHRFRDVDVLVIDDIHYLTRRDRTQEEFFHTFNCLYQSGKQIVLSSDAPPEEIPDLEERLVSRFKCGLVAKVDPPCFETRVAILKTKARIRGVELSDDAVNYIASVIDTNTRELEGAIIKAQVLSSVENRPIDLSLVRAALGNIGPSNGAEPSIQAIIGAVTDFYRIKTTDLQSKRRQRSVAVPRQVCMYLARRFTRHSLEEIGGYFGGRDHTTVMHAVKMINTRRATDSNFELVVKDLEERVRPVRP